MLISTGRLTPKSLEGQTAIVTGAGRGIGYEAARSLVWLGARVVIAEIDKETGSNAAGAIQAEFGNDRVIFEQTNVGDEASVLNLKHSTVDRFGKVDIVINNATVTPMGAVQDLPISMWDASYQVNLRGPVILAQSFIPGMLHRKYGVFICVTSVGQAYMGAYETFKSAQAHLADTLDAELEGTGVFAFTIGPGLVQTPGAIAGVTELAPLYGQTVEEFLAMSKDHLIPAEAAGAGFAAAVVFAEKYKGQEVSSKQALMEAGIAIESSTLSATDSHLSAQDLETAIALTQRVRVTIAEQSEGWKERPFFERQWMFRDFKKNAGMSVERWLEALDQFEAALASDQGRVPSASIPPLGQLAAFYAHLSDLAAGYEKDPQKLGEQIRVIDSWKNDVDALISLIGIDG
jgi:NAD(P)-dependent dehydrogenase (short-subunit alcohol dehydrogenase family)